MATMVKDHIQRLDEAFLRRMLSIRSAPLTDAAKVLNVLGSAAITDSTARADRSGSSFSR